MEKSYRRYENAVEYAQESVKSIPQLRLGLKKAIREIGMLHKTDIPKRKQDFIQAVLDSCRTSEPKDNEGIFKASIDSMTYEEQNELKNKIELL